MIQCMNRFMIGEQVQANLVVQMDGFFYYTMLSAKTLDLPPLHSITTYYHCHAMKSTKVQTPGTNTMCAHDWSCVGEKLANTTTATGATRYIATYPGNGYNGSETG